MGKYRVALIHNIIAPYRVPLFDALSKHPSIDLTVFFCAKTHKMRKWIIPQKGTYKNEVLSGVTVEFGEYVNHFNPLIIWRLLQGDFDIIIVAGYSDLTMQIGFLTSRLLEIPVILWSEGTEGTQTLLGKVLDPLTKLMITRAAGLIVPGTKARDFHVKRGAASRKIFTAPNVVDNDLYIEKSKQFRNEKEWHKNKLGIESGKVVLFVGQLIRRKGVEYLLRAFKRAKNDLEDVCLVLVGDGSSKQELERLCTEERINDVFFTGWVSEEQKIVYYSIADLFVLPTIRDVWALVINEAMCCHLPIVTTTAAACSADMIVPDKNGFIVNPKDADQLYSAMKTILSDDSLRNEMGKRSLTIVAEQFNLDEMVKGFLSAIEYAYRRGPSS